MNCKGKENKLDICFAGNEGYKYPFPVVLDTFLFVNEIVEINENKNRISLQLNMWMRWSDPGLSLSNKSKM